MRKRTNVADLRRGEASIAESYDRYVEQQYDERKFTELLVFVADRLREDAGGPAKLNKVLYFADFAHFRRTGRSITGAAYQKLASGPAPISVLSVRSNLIAAHEAELEEHHFLGYRQHRLVPKRSADVSVFTPEELATISDVLNDLEGMNARDVSELSREEAGWRLTEEGETIPYVAALIPREQPVTPTALAQGKRVAERYGIPTSL